MGVWISKPEITDHRCIKQPDDQPAGIVLPVRLRHSRHIRQAGNLSCRPDIPIHLSTFLKAKTPKHKPLCGLSAPESFYVFSQQRAATWEQ
ncbi:hypothetical protein DYJ25_07420 [Prevotella denticola]|nr:hypothetical protein DYJ25_07420 [Prevotella denticola]